MSPEGSSQASPVMVPERQPAIDDLSPISLTTEKHDGPQSDVMSRSTSPEKDAVSLEMELFGVATPEPSKIEEGAKKQEREAGSKLKTARRKKLTGASENDRNGSVSIGSGPAPTRLKTNGLPSRMLAKHHSAKAPKGPREIVIINTVKGTVRLSTISTPLSVQPRLGAAHRSSKPLSPSKVPKGDVHKPSATNLNGSGPRRPSLLHSDQIVASAMNRYKNHFHMLVEDSDSTVASNPSSTGGADSMHIALEYPGKDSREKYALMKPFLSRSKTETDDKDEYNPIDDLIQTAQIITEHFFSPERSKELFGTSVEGLQRNLTKYKVRKDGAQFMKAVEEFNTIMKKQKAAGSIQEHLKKYGPRIPYDLVVHVLQQVYSRTVAARASKLNQYEAFSNNVYGEILPILTKEFIHRTKVDHTKVFVDLGCGIGNVVLQVALQTGAESYGVEIMDTPAKFAKKQAKEFEARCRAYGLKHGQVSMIHGDFLETPGLPGILARADVVLVNNYAFNSALNQSLLQLFLDLKEGCKIISLKTFVPLDHKINVRNAGSVESILRVKKYPYYTNNVSWTHNGGEYFVATVDRTAMQAFWANGRSLLEDGTSRRTSTRRR